jgi:hypothetical protein
MNFYSRISLEVKNIDKSSTAWSDYKTAVRVRDRLTHPKGPDDLMCDESTVELMQRVSIWMIGTLLSTVPSMRYLGEEIKKHLPSDIRIVSRSERTTIIAANYS